MFLVLELPSLKIFLMCSYFLLIPTSLFLQSLFLSMKKCNVTTYHNSSLRKPIIKMFHMAYCSHVSGCCFWHVIMRKFDKEKLVKMLFLSSFLFITGDTYLNVILIMKLINNFH